MADDYCTTTKCSRVHAHVQKKDLRFSRKKRKKNRPSRPIRPSEMIAITILVSWNTSTTLKYGLSLTPSHSRANGVIKELSPPSFLMVAQLVYKGQPSVNHHGHQTSNFFLHTSSNLQVIQIYLLQFQFSDQSHVFSQITMLNKVQVKLTGIFFFILYISATSATPVGEPGKAQNINDDIHPRVDYYPYQCRYPYTWIRRECVPAVSLLAWQDVCAYITARYNFVPRYDNRPGNCPAGTTCLDGFNTDGRRFISCVSNGKDKGKRKIDPQVGISGPKKARNELANTQAEYSVKIDHDMTAASVAAVLESECCIVNVHLSFMSRT